MIYSVSISSQLTVNITLLTCEPQVNVQGSSNGESYQERLSRLEGDKESLVLQVKHGGNLLQLLS